jgi:carbon starvation protein CstA
MITFITAVILLVLGYIFYGKFVESIFKPDVNRATPAYTHADGVDFVPMNSNKIPDSSFKYCGVGPIFGPILGALYGPVAFFDSSWLYFLRCCARLLNRNDFD